ncbi:hypothetical protein [Photorhabdus hindustanensis]|uniref:Uncharacterized protein n=1 Tax=Photorhabdus hindustanensis TaxID=2918802 RepID=A0A2S8PZH8_9GAMM|nr:hypothetical protein [Photorhabdus hindustanensis]PQQ24675.1 hypothetical protein C6H66_14960 [Photorhabdus hindustanensis]
MMTLSLVSFKIAILLAFNQWLDQNTEDATVNLEGHNVTVTFQLDGDKFNCGVPGFNLPYIHENDLRNWVGDNIYIGNNIGYLSPLRDDSVNVWLKGGVAVMFNFHVNLYVN